MEVYLDNSATTNCYDSVVDIVTKTMKVDYGNPSSTHNKGVEAERYVKWSKEVIANQLKVQQKELYFTSGGTEGNNLALIGAARANKRRGRHCITTKIEHPSVLNVMHYLEAEGFEVTYLSVDESGKVDLQELKAALRPDTILVSVMHVNNEIGTIQPIEEISQIVHRFQKDIIFHVDGVQGFGKIRMHPKRIGVDMLTVSGHKIHGPKGSGVLYINQKVKCNPIMIGGGQQQGMRSGTENVPGIAGIGMATKEGYYKLDEKVYEMLELRKYFIEGLQEIEECEVHGPCERCAAPHIISVGFAGVKSEVLLHALEENEIYVSAGSACASNHPGISSVLKAIKVENKYLDSTIRFSMSSFTTKEEIDYTLETLYNLIPILRKYMRR